MGIIPRMGLDLSEGILQVAYRQGLIYFQPFSFDTGPDTRVIIPGLNWSSTRQSCTPHGIASKADSPSSRPVNTIIGTVAACSCTFPTVSIPGVVR